MVNLKDHEGARHDVGRRFIVRRPGAPVKCRAPIRCHAPKLGLTARTTGEDDETSNVFLINSYLSYANRLSLARHIRPSIKVSVIPIPQTFSSFSMVNRRPHVSCPFACAMHTLSTMGALFGRSFGNARCGSVVYTGSDPSVV